MAKIKKKRAGLSDKVTQSRRKDKLEKINPFEIKTNRQKHNVLGRRISKHDQGRPGVSRSKAIKKRQQTLLKEYKQSTKSNRFIDKRIGENDRETSVEEKMMQRFAMEKQRSHAPSKLYNLESDDLTHFGQSLSEIEKFDDPIISDDEDDADRGKLSGKLSEELFGGFLEKKPDEPGTKKSWKEKMQDMIVNSKKEKYERQSETENVKDLTLEVDKQWKSLCFLMSDCRRDRYAAEVESKVDDYDIAVNTMRFEVTVMPTDRLKTEEEIAKDEIEKLKKLEDDRLKRMSGVIDAGDQPRSSKHRSADDLDDGYNPDSVAPDAGTNRDGNVVRFDERTNSDEDEDDGDDNDNDEKDEDEEEGGDIDDNSDEEDDSADDLESEEEDGDDVRMEETNETMPKSILKKSTSSSSLKKIDFKLHKRVMDKARAEMPYTFKAPESYDELETLLEGHSSEDKIELISRLRKCHHMSLAGGNKEKLELLFAFLLQYFCDTALQDVPDYAVINGLTTHLYHLSQQSPINSASSTLDVVAMRQREFSDLARRKGGRGLYPTFDVLLLLRLIAVLFPTSDNCHPVVTPALLFMLQILSQSPVTSVKDVASGLFLCHLCLDYATLSKRFIPEVINYLLICLCLAADKQPHTSKATLPPLKSDDKSTDLLVVTECVKGDVCGSMKLSEVLAENVDAARLNTPSFRLQAVHCCVKEVSRASVMYAQLPSYREIFSPILTSLLQLPTQYYPESVQTEIRNLAAVIENISSQPRSHLLTQKPRPTSLRMYECEVEDKFDGRKKHKGKPEQKEQQRMKYLYKKEMKGAIRELKKDSQFLARQRHEEQLHSDGQRKRKVKEIYSMLSMQEGEYNKLVREKNKGKK